ncbi:MAG: CBS domain-containing protein [Desulfosporosinus sp.]|nr:CBS domain-containing protein [Desulfosporosinus sp.]
MDLTSFFVHMDKTVNDAVKQIDITGKKIVFIVDDNKRLVGVFTDGDMRRHILNKGKLTDCVTEAMNRNPICFTLENEWQINNFWTENRLVAIPIVDHNMKVVKARFWNDEVISEKFYTIPNDVPVVIMAGGRERDCIPTLKFFLNH